MKERGGYMLSNPVAIVQEYNHGLAQQYEELSTNYEELKLNVESLYEKGINTKEYSNKLSNHVDNLVIDHKNNKEYLEYEIAKKKVIEKQIKDYYNFDVEKLEKILKVRNNIMKKRLDSLHLDNIGTALNVLRDLYHDVHIDFERNKRKKMNGDVYKFEGLSIDFNFDIEELLEPLNVHVTLKGE